MPAVPEPDHPAPAQIGPFTVLERIGQGGMGTVHLAEQRQPVRRRVAIKLIKLGMDSKAVLARFGAEQQALSLMNHPAIAQVLEAGITDAGQPWFAMEWVPGVPITDYCDQNRLTVDERIGLFLQVCDGVQHAHHKGVMHRDLKPSNILVTMHDGRPVPKIIDFGLAKAIDHRLTAGTLFTEQGQVVGTPGYMSPEQATGNGLDVDTRTDVHALGVLLYELLTGDLPIPHTTLRQTNWTELQRLIREFEPPRPSARASAATAELAETARRRRTGVVQLRQQLRGDLDWIVMRAIEKDRTRRYQSARELAEDLERHRRHEPVSAGPPRLGYRLGKFVRRHRLQVGFAAVLLLTLLGGIAGTTWFAIAAADQAQAVRRRQREFDLLAGVVQLQNALAQAARLQPAWPEQLPGLRQWLEHDAAALVAMRADVVATLAEIERRRAGEPAAEARAGDSQQFLYATLGQLRDGIDRLASTQLPEVRRRLEWASRIDRLTDAHPAATVTWAQAAAAIASSARYQSPPIALVPQTGLVPLGENPASGLWEFYDLRSACDPATDDPANVTLPRHAADGTLPLHERTGIVFVLIPGGTFDMGSQDLDAGQPNFDAAHGGNEGPVHAVTLAPFLVSRYELTQAQWLRLSGGEQPALHGVGDRYEDPMPFTWLHPVEQVSWNACTGLLHGIGADLPTEAQWEYAARAGTATAWWTGGDESTLAGAANVFDRRAAPQFNTPVPPAPFDDGYAGPSPVGSYRANAFGLHDICGNVMEWCRDVSGPYSRPARAGDGLRSGAEDGELRVIRDGSYQAPASMARSAARDQNSPTITFPLLGVRPARALR